VIEHLEARLFGRGWSAEKARLVEVTLVPGAKVSAIARRAGMAPSQLFGWRRQARGAALRRAACVERVLLRRKRCLGTKRGTPNVGNVVTRKHR
jgi:transposase-like protein